MSDDALEAPAPPPIGGDRESLRDAGDELQRKRDAGELAPRDAEPEPSSDVTKLRDDGTEPLSWRQAAARVASLRRAEAQNAAYAAPVARALDERLAVLGSSDPERAARIEQAAVELLRSFSDLRSAEDVARLQREDPGRYERYAHLDSLVRSVPDLTDPLVADLHARFPELKGVRTEADLEAFRARDPARFAAAYEAWRAAEQGSGDPDLDLQQRHAALETERQALEQEREVERRIGELSSSAQQLAATVKAAGLEFQAAFSDIRTEADLAALAQSDPQRFALYQQSRANLDAGVRHVHAQLQQQHEVKKAEWDKISTANDDYWMAQHPELKDPARLSQTAAAATAALEKVGLTGKDLQELWEGRATISLRDWRTQEVLWMAGEYMRGQQALQESRAGARNGKQLPPVQKPGVGRDHASDGRAQRIESLNRRISSTTGHKQMQLLAERLTLQQRER